VLELVLAEGEHQQVGVYVRGRSGRGVEVEHG
jgi:hypothetical protein